MTTVNEDIELTLTQSVLDCNLGIPMAFQNLPFQGKPEDGSEWGAAFILPYPSAPVTMGAEGEDTHGGILQIDLNYPLLSGTGAARAKADEVATFYTAGKPLSHRTFKGWIRSCSVGQGREVNGHWKVIINIIWGGRAPRNA